ncbi:hypothetical protein [Streptomyces sp. NPDC006971]|uniref:hypothetical protein n=1 Tax=Streptomyces sp. NPDC006971 TaxID=3154784 RepID=UPI0033D7823D
MTENAGMPQPGIRVAAYVIRHRAAPELLVFDHVGIPEAGTQVPAGGVRPGEGFSPLPLKQPLADDQDAWLDRIDPRWITVPRSHQ